MEGNTFEGFTKIYKLSKTLRFELIPVSSTMDKLTKSDLLKDDQHRAESYVQVKKIIDEYHKAFIESVLDQFKFFANENKKNFLKEFYTCYTSKDDAQKNAFKEIQGKLREQIADAFKKDDRYKRIDKKEFIKEDLKAFVEKSKEGLINEFLNFTTYFKGFHENRKNMYSAEAQSTAIAYRLTHENLPKFIDNMSVFDKIAEKPVAEHLPKLYADFEEYLNVRDISEMFKLDYFNHTLTQKQIDVYNAIIGGKVLDDGTKIKGLNEYINLYNQQQKDKSNRLPKLKSLYKQILSDRNALSWLPEQFESDEKVLEAIEKAYQELDKQVLNRKKEGEHSLKELLLNLADYELDKIYVRNDVQISDISQKMFGYYGTISKALLEKLKSYIPRKSKKETDEAYEERIGKILKSQGSISIAQINNSVKAPEAENSNTIQAYFATLGAVKTGTHRRRISLLK